MELLTQNEYEDRKACEEVLHQLFLEMRQESDK